MVAFAIAALGDFAALGEAIAALGGFATLGGFAGLGGPSLRLAVLLRLAGGVQLGRSDERWRKGPRRAQFRSRPARSHRAEAAERRGLFEHGVALSSGAKQ